MIDIKQSALPQARPGRLPSWLKKPLAYAGKCDATAGVLAESSLNTVCREAKCPNRSECFSRGTATFLVMGKTCTRSCAFCGVAHGLPQPLDKDEPGRVASAVAAMGLTHAVITSVTRDDLPDGGAAHFAEVIRMLKQRLPHITVEVLTPDFRGSIDSLAVLLSAGPDVFNHNIETVPRLYPVIRPQALYRRSLEILAQASRFATKLKIKSGLMVGLGETRDEVHETMRDMRNVGCRFLTVGQYLQPSKDQAPVVEFVNPTQFDQYRTRALAMGFSDVHAGPFVRSSYRAETMV